MLLFAALSSESRALAVERFECGVYQLYGRLYLSGSQSTLTEQEKKLNRSPLLVLWEKSLSETKIPLAIYPFQKEALSKFGLEPLIGAFEIEIRERGLRPTYGRYVSFRPASPTAITEATSLKKFLKRLPCDPPGASK